MASRSLIPFLVAMMLLTGVCNTLLTKYQDNQCVRNCGPDDSPRKRAFFNQPVLQTAQMFIGEMGCWLVVGLMALWRRFNGSAPQDRGYQAVDTEENGDAEAAPRADDRTKLLHTGPSILRGYRVTLLALPAICDICGTTLMNAGLLMVAASIYQMTRGALVLFVGLFSVVFLKRHLHLFQWLSLVGVVLGVAVVGLAGAIWPDEKPENSIGQPEEDSATDRGLSDAARAIVGVLLIAGAQIFTATQFVLEEYLLERSTIDPIRVVGWEGLFGFSVTLLAMLVLHATIGSTEAGKYGYFDIVEGWRQMTENKQVLISSFLIMISIGGFNFFGLSVTRSVSATSRSTIDTCRTLFIWIVSLGLGWETFKWLQIVGFALLVYFTFLFNGIVQPPLEFLRVPDDEVEELLPEEPIEHR
ncbi:nucleotide-sugar transporter [Fusarium coicis]|nr:nucleotide-sugar transporter [Fusarium coicis]